eukprot:15175945-Ditylum_brightwellii.AAC.1
MDHCITFSVAKGIQNNDLDNAIYKVIESYIGLLEENAKHCVINKGDLIGNTYYTAGGIENT